ncbi:MAG: glutamine-hydrolyzing GMP synthase [Spirochaetales bacterium]|nr:glutamine-hydrolyzing GMP synthase [Spirochaetales bacterium]
MDRILILDFGGQTTQLIGRRIRDFGVYSEIAPGTSEIADILTPDVKGIILSGSPHSSWEEGTPQPDPALFDCGLPLLGICYGFHQITRFDGGVVKPLPHREYGRSQVQVVQNDPLFEGIEAPFDSWMSHGDSVDAPGRNHDVIAVSENGVPAAIAHRDKMIRGVQFHPEASHCEHGTKILENFAVGICGCQRQWTLEQYIERQRSELQQQAAEKDVLLLISGGVDSTVAAALLLKALPAERVWLMYVDTGMMRKGESDEVAKNLKALGAKNLLLIDAKDRFLQPLSGVEDPEKKRKLIGDAFIRVQEEEVAKHLPPGYLLAQGTLYTDLIESGMGVGKNAQVIKSHHNVGTPLVRAKRDAGELIEPLDQLYKDEVRRLGLMLGVDPAIVHRHPFPGPGLAIRILSDITEEKLEILREADAIYISELRQRGLYDQIWQAFSVLLPVRSVGVTGDARDYGFVLGLRAVTSSDGMTADVYDFPTKDLLEISAKITNSVKQIGRVVYDISSKPPATIEWE